MKKFLYITAIALGVGTFTYGQSGTNLLFGSLGTGSTESVSGDSKYLDFKLGLGYQFDRNWTVGITGGYGTDRLKEVNTSDWSFVNSYHIGPFVRYTNPLSKLFAFYAQAEGGYVGSTIGNTKSAIRYNSTNGFYASVYPAISVFFYKGWALNFSIGGLDFKDIEYENGNSITDVDFSIGKQASVGVSVNFMMMPHPRFERHHNRERIQEDDGYSDWSRDRKSYNDDDDD